MDEMTVTAATRTEGRECTTFGAGATPSTARLNSRRHSYGKLRRYKVRDKFLHCSAGRGCERGVGEIR